MSDQRLVPLGPAEEVWQRCRTDQTRLLLQKLDLNINIISILDWQNIALQETDLKQNILAPYALVFRWHLMYRNQKVFSLLFRLYFYRRFTRGCRRGYVCSLCDFPIGTDAQ